MRVETEIIEVEREVLPESPLARGVRVETSTIYAVSSVTRRHPSLEGCGLKQVLESRPVMMQLSPLARGVRVETHISLIYVEVLRSPLARGVRVETSKARLTLTKGGCHPSLEGCGLKRIH